MPVVRELVNRISFKVNPGDTANAQKAFGNMKGQAGGVIGFAKGIGTAIKAATVALAALTVAGVKFATDAEKNKATVYFFSKTNAEAEKLLGTIEKLRNGDRDIISKAEVDAAGAMFSKLNLGAGSFAEIAPILQLITKANPKMDFAQVTQSVKQFIESGDLDALKQLGGVGKDEAEKLALSGMDVNSSIKGQDNKYQWLMDKLNANKGKIQEDADRQEGTQTHAWQGLGKEGSDFLYKFGSETSPAITEAVSAARDLLKEINQSEGFWTGVSSAIEGIGWMLEKIADAIRFLRNFGGEGSGPSSLQSAGNEMGDKYMQHYGQKKGPGATANFLADQVGKVTNSAAGQEAVKDVKHTGEIVIRGEGLEGIDMSKIQENVNKQLANAFNGIANQNSRGN